MGLRQLMMVGLLMMSGTAWASTQQEIAHLLDYVANTDCQYERNSTLHSGKEAVAHIEKKYHYFRKKVTTAEEFISYAASQSLMSGSVYRVHCPGKPTQHSQQWLLDELAAYRAK